MNLVTRKLSVLFNFDSTSGTAIETPLIQHTNGKLYGLAAFGGAYGKGTFFTIDLGFSPFAGLVRSFGRVGTTVDVLGQGFTGSTNVTFNGVSATFTVVSDTYLTATVPTGATTGFVTVTTPTGTLNSNKKFQVTP